MASPEAAPADLGGGPHHHQDAKTHAHKKGPFKGFRGFKKGHDATRTKRHKLAALYGEDITQARRPFLSLTIPKTGLHSGYCCASYSLVMCELQTWVNRLAGALGRHLQPLYRDHPRVQAKTSSRHDINTLACKQSQRGHCWLVLSCPTSHYRLQLAPDRSRPPELKLVS